MLKKLLLLLIFIGSFVGCTLLVDSEAPKSIDWNSYSSDHYQFYVRPGSPAEDAIDQIREEQEWAYREINNRLNLSFGKKLQVYIYDSEQDMGTTDRTGKAYPELSTIEAMYSNQIKSIGVRGVSMHELSHVVAFYGLCPTPEPLFAEGLAVWLDNYWNDPDIPSTGLYRVSRVHLQQGNLPDVETMMEGWSQIPSKYSYPAAGSFARYLIEQYGLESFKTLYCNARADNYRSIFFEIYERELNQVETEYRVFLRNR